MVVRLCTEKGEIKEYQTVNEVRTLCGEYSTIDKWVGAKCGTEWYKEPTPQQECDHLECAIRFAEEKVARKKSMPYLATIFLIASLVIYFIMPYGTTWLETLMDSTSATILIAIHIVFSLFVALIAIMIYFVDDAEELLDELNEFKNNGTIKGIKACQISKDREKAKS